MDPSKFRIQNHEISMLGAKRYLIVIKNVPDGTFQRTCVWKSIRFFELSDLRAHRSVGSCGMESTQRCKMCASTRWGSVYARSGAGEGEMPPTGIGTRPQRCIIFA